MDTVKLNKVYNQMNKIRSTVSKSSNSRLWMMLLEVRAVVGNDLFEKSEIKFNNTFDVGHKWA